MIYLCRHGQTVFNTLGRFQGQLDSPLTALGQRQASAMGVRLRGLVKAEFRLFASPLGRAQQSAQAIAMALGGAEVCLDPRLMEIGMGSWDGMTDFEVEAEYPGARDGILPGEWHFRAADGESYAAFAARLAAVMAEIAADPVADKIVVSHGMAGRVIRGQWAGLGKAATLALGVPQDAIFALGEAAGIVRIDCLAAGGAAG